MAGGTELFLVPVVSKVVLTRPPMVLKFLLCGRVATPMLLVILEVAHRFTPTRVVRGILFPFARRRCLILAMLDVIFTPRRFCPLQLTSSTLCL